MKKQFKNYLILWATLLVLFNVIAFVSVGWKGVEKYTPSFWIGYAFITLSFVGQLICSKIAFNADTARKNFYNLPYITTSFSGLIVSFIVGGLCMLNSLLPYWVGIIVCSIILVINVIDVIKVNVAVTEVERIDEKVQTQTSFIKFLTADADTLVKKSKTEEMEKLCVKVYEAFRFSNKMSNPALGSLETEISDKFSAFSNAVALNNVEEAKTNANELIVLLEERNNKCKVMR